MGAGWKSGLAYNVRVKPASTRRKITPGITVKNPIRQCRFPAMLAVLSLAAAVFGWVM